MKVSKANSEQEFIRECIRKIQLNCDKESFMYLFNRYYKDSCKYAYKFLNRRVYSDMISWTPEEVESYVFIAFWKAIKNYKLESTSKTYSFKNYLYWLIQFESFNEMKTNFNWQCIPAVCKKLYQEDSRQMDYNNPLGMYHKLENINKAKVIYNFLLEKNDEYALIWKLKIGEVKNKEICKKLNLKPNQLKSRWQYIRKLVVEKYVTIDNVY